MLLGMCAIIVVSEIGVERMDDMEFKPTKEQFEDYVKIRNSGVTNMCDVNMVCALSDTGLVKDICLYIMYHFKELADEYEAEI